MNWYKNSRDIYITVEAITPDILFAAHIISNKLNNYKLRILIYELGNKLEKKIYYNISFDRAKSLAKHNFYIANEVYNTDANAISDSIALENPAKIRQLQRAL